MRTIILSVTPFFSKKIFNGSKTIELRKVVGVDFLPSAKVFVYQTSPTKSLVGSFVISQIEVIPPEDISEEQLKMACVDREFYEEYFQGKKQAYLIHLEKVSVLAKSICLSTLREFGFVPPQSFCYVPERLLEVLPD